MRFAIVVLLVGLWGCAMESETSEPWTRMDPFWEEAILRSNDPTGMAMCHHGCPVVQLDGKAQWPWHGMTFEQVMLADPTPCPRWTATVITREALATVDSWDNGTAARRPDSLDVADYGDTSDGLNDRSFTCRWDQHGSVLAEDRLRESMEVTEVRTLQGPLYSEEIRIEAKAMDGYLVPDTYWKVVSIIGASRLRTLAFIAPFHLDAQVEICPYIVTIDEVEEASGLDLFHLATDDTFEATNGDLAEAIGC